MGAMRDFQPNAYGPVFAALIDRDRRRPLDAGAPQAGDAATLEAATLKSLFAHSQIVDEAMARCCLSGVWLLCDFLDESHTISQGISTPSGSFWHGIMHRREGDFSNAKYWFRKVGEHPVYERLAAAAGSKLGIRSSLSTPASVRCGMVGPRPSDVASGSRRSGNCCSTTVTKGQSDRRLRPLETLLQKLILDASR